MMYVVYRQRPSAGGCVMYVVVTEAISWGMCDVCGGVQTEAISWGMCDVCGGNRGHQLGDV